MVPQLVFVGSPSLDRVTLADGARSDSVGGAAFISALAARWAGAPTGVVARVPSALPEGIARVFGPGGLHRGGLRPAEGALPSFHIRYDADHRSTYTHVDNGLEGSLLPEDIPAAWRAAPHLHLAPIGEDAKPQLAMLAALRGWGVPGSISAGTYRRMVALDLDGARALLAAVDLFFCNAEELAALCPHGPPAGTTVCVTDGSRGVSVHRDGQVQHHPAPPARVVDATGAGDAFCGGYLAGRALGTDPVASGLAAARFVLSGRGAAPLQEAVAAGVGPRAVQVPARVAAVGAALADHAAGAAFDFAQPPHLPAGHDHALAMLCIATAHQFGFWTATAADGWGGPMYATLEGRRYKGSDFVWAAFSRAARERPELLEPGRMAADPASFLTICTADDGRCPLPEQASYVALHGAHGAAMQARWPGGYGALLADCNAADAPVSRLLHHLAQLPGYAEDPLAKKANLLAIILANRPERFLDARDREHIQPIVDYHLMRACLRTGCVDILDPDLERRLAARTWVDGVEEAEIRQASFTAIAGLVAASGRSVAAVDGFFFALGRKVCVETAAPDCARCTLAPCARHVDRFQPVFRTTAY